MTSPAARPSLLRRRKAHEHGRVTFVELFFDLVFVFAVTQLSHTLLQDLSLAGALRTGLLFLPVWWVWVYTSWVTNWLDPDRPPVRLMLFALMLAGLVLSTSLPEAFGEKGLVFAAAFVAMHVGRSAFTLWAVRGHSPTNYRNFQRITLWLAGVGVLWIAGGLAEGDMRLGLWAAAVAIDYVLPSIGFWLPRLGRSITADWDVEGAHMAERCALFVIIALGESILVTGAAFAQLAWDAVTATAFLVAFAGSVAMWWVYFNIGAEHASRTIAASADPGRIARAAYTYAHLPLVAGIVVSAVADELVLVHPGGHTGLAAAAVILGGPALYLAGNLVFKRLIWGRAPLSHLAGLGLLALLVPAVPGLPPLALGAATTVVMIVVAAWETVSLRASR